MAGQSINIGCDGREGRNYSAEGATVNHVVYLLVCRLCTVVLHCTVIYAKPAKTAAADDPLREILCTGILSIKDRGPCQARFPSTRPCKCYVHCIGGLGREVKVKEEELH